MYFFFFKKETKNQTVFLKHFCFMVVSYNDVLFPQQPLTKEVVPFRVQVGLVGQTAAHHVQTVILAGFQGHLA